MWFGRGEADKNWDLIWFNPQKFVDFTWFNLDKCEFTWFNIQKLGFHLQSTKMGGSTH